VTWRGDDRMEARRDRRGIAIAHDSQVLAPAVGVVADLHSEAIVGVHAVVVDLLELYLISAVAIVPVGWEG